MNEIAGIRVKQQIDEALRTAHHLRDQIHAELHDLSLDARQHWSELERRLAQVERTGLEVSESARTAAAAIARRLRQFRDAVHNRVP